jgi:hypothetical protein
MEDEDGRSSTGIPAESATSFRKPTDEVKSMVYFREKKRCWLCKERYKPGLEVAHNIDASIEIEKVCSSVISYIVLFLI